jgi:hypothetical protein
MKARFDRGELKEINPEKDYLGDNGLCVKLITTDPDKMVFRNRRLIEDFKFAKRSFGSLLKRDLIYLEQDNGRIKYYFFRGSVKKFDEIV